LEQVVVHDHGLLNPITPEGFFPIRFFDKLAVTMTSCFKVEEETYEEDDKE